ncbi:MAG TPA: DUF4242 domain-containing protein [Steroidobacteraceae bacterium]|jgi:ABC-type glycerol-3-phosphate transport system substrate-binding protein|nr:DUF4242 domain-containing protein [Steroidobacteraceae bacterium]
MKKIVIATLGSLLLGIAAAAIADDASTAAHRGVHRYVVERTFPAGALDHLDSALKAKVNANNAKFGVRWVLSYANATKTKTYCIYQAPNAAAIRQAAAANGLPVDSITEVPVTLNPK